MKNADFSNNSFECKESNMESAISNEELNELKIFDTDKNEYSSDCDSEGNFTLNTTHQHEIFTGKDAEAAATRTAEALADYFDGNGCFKVYERNESTFVIQFDECQVRDGIEDDSICQFNQHSNSGTYSWEEVITFNVMD